jgi:16S rRNA (guanine527-N7)-methyltransferase
VATPRIGVSRETEARLRDLAALVLEWNARIGLIAASTEAEIWTRHCLDSAQLVALLPPNPGRVLDLGSGAGFPGLVIGLVGSVPVTLVEADARKAAFLRTAAARVGVDARVIDTRIETAVVPDAPVRVVTARALAPLDRLLSLAARFCDETTVSLFPKGRMVEQEIAQARRRWRFEVERVPSVTASDSCVLRVTELRRA